MGVRKTRRAFILGAALAASPLGATEPITVSPGELDRISRIEARCPTFSWGWLADADELVLSVISLDDREKARAVLRTRLPGSVTSWTPSLGSCLEPGGRYAWFVEVERRASDGHRPAGLTSEPRLFEVAVALASRDLRAAVDEVLAERGAGDPGGPVARSRSGRERRESDPPRVSSSMGSAAEFSVDDAGNVWATAYAGDGSGLTNVTASALDFEITGAHIDDFSIGLFDIGAGAVSTLQIFDNTVASVDIQDGTITGGDIGLETVTGANIDDGSLTGADIASSSLNGTDILNDSLSYLDLADYPGVEYVGDGVDQGASGTVQSLTISAPTAGHVIAFASGVANISATGSTSLECSLTTGTTVDANARVDLTQSHPIALTRGFSVGAGSVTIRLVCSSTTTGSPPPPPPAIKDPYMTAVFSPTRY